jgi:hypothetical protein
MANRVEKRTLETCARHGLRYEAQRGGCVLCLRGAAPSEHPRRASLAWILTALGALGLAGTLIFSASRCAGPKLVTDVPEAARECVSARIEIMNKCIQHTCRRGLAGEPCRLGCVTTLNDTVHVCAGMPEPPEAGYQVLFGTGKVSTWTQLPNMLRAPMAVIRECPYSRTNWTAIVGSRWDSTVVDVDLGIHQFDSAECITTALRGIDRKLLGGENWSFVIHAATSTTARPEIPQPPPSPVEPSFDITAAPKPAPAQPVSTRIRDQGDAELIQAQLRRVRRECEYKSQRECALELERLRGRFATLIAEDKSVPVQPTRVVLNSLGVGFDCVRAEPRSGAFRASTTLVVARPPQAAKARWRLISERPVDAVKSRETGARGPWPSNYRAEVYHLGRVRSEALSLCFELDGTEPSTWQFGMVTYDMGPGASHIFPRWSDDLQSLGLVASSSEGSQLRVALSEANVAETKRLLAEGARLETVLGALSLALAAGWPIDDIGVLLRAGGNPDEIGDSGWTPLHAVIAASYQRDPTNDRKVAHAVQEMLRAGGDANRELSVGTPLHLAAQRGLQATWETLVDAGADPDRPNRMGVTPRQLRNQLWPFWR